jgi:hypothetical protein
MSDYYEKEKAVQGYSDDGNEYKEGNSSFYSTIPMMIVTLSLLHSALAILKLLPKATSPGGYPYDIPKRKARVVILKII